jgi:AraC-like DNA-binding protein
MDVLANVLGHTQVGNASFCQSELVGQWGILVEPQSKTAAHLVRRGVCWLRVDGFAAPMRLVAGDVVLVAQGVRHSMTDSPDGPAEPWQIALPKLQRRFENEGPHSPDEITTLLCASYELEQDGQQPLLAFLPKLIRLHVDANDEQGQFHSLIRLLLHEAGRKQAGAEIVVPRLVDSLFVYILRAWLQEQPDGAAGWFGALRDPQIGRSLALIHENPDRPWTVEALAGEVALSRAAFARRFGELVGEPPLKYLTRWRMNVAARILKTTSDSVDAVACRVGYESPTAFGKAFHRHLRTSPGRYRAQQNRHESAARALT